VQQPPIALREHTRYPEFSRLFAQTSCAQLIRRSLGRSVKTPTRRSRGFGNKKYQVGIKLETVKKQSLSQTGWNYTL